MTLFWDPDNYTGGFDVAEVQHLAADFDANDPTNDGIVTDDEIPWVLVGICIACAIVAPALGMITVQAVLHWRGALELLLAAGIISYFLRGTR
jgi:hypothetical protein